MKHLRWFWRALVVYAVLLLLGGLLLGWLAARRDVGPFFGPLLALYFVVALLMLGGLAAVLLPAGRSLSILEDRLRRLETEEPDVCETASESGEVAPLLLQFSRTQHRLAERFSQLRQTQKSLQEQEEFLQRVLQTMVEAVVVVDGAQRVLFANRAAYRLLDLPVSDLRERPLWEVVRSPALRQAVQRVLNQGEDVRLELTLPRNDWVVRLAASSLPGDPPSGAVLVLHDITELRRLENLRRDFVSNVSHELKTPLTSIQAYAETLLDGALEDAAHSREFVGRIAEAAERLHTLILDLLALARIEAEEEAFQIQPVSVRQAVEECWHEHRGVAQSRRISLTAEECPAEVFVRADAEGLRTILNNLVDNALNYTLPGGTVHIGCSEQQGRVRLDVSDTGIGIPREHRDRIFERFYRVDRARSRELGGTGLGLAIVKHLVQVFGGQVTLESEPGKGSTFSVFLPVGVASPDACGEDGKGDSAVPFSTGPVFSVGDGPSEAGKEPPSS